jgi:Leucine-rich repeat (LRR) protein
MGVYHSNSGLWNVENKNLQKLPSPLPPTLRTLLCGNNALTALPNPLPDTIYELYCERNLLTHLPPLPDKLEYLYCQRNRLMALPPYIPKGARDINCSNNKITALPEVLPDNLYELHCENNRLTMLPDLPTKLLYFSFQNNPLEQNYPKLATFELIRFSFRCIYNTYVYQYPKEVIAYVNECNSRMRTQSRTRIIAPGIADHYYRKALHPSNLAPLLDDPDADPQDFMDALDARI